jgi:hypothetical protein
MLNTQRKSREWLLEYGPFTGIVRMGHGEACDYAASTQGDFSFLDRQHQPCTYSHRYQNRIFAAR